MWERRDSTNHMRNHLKMMLVCWNAELVSRRLAEFEQVLCKLPEQPCMPMTLSLVCVQEGNRAGKAPGRLKGIRHLCCEIMQGKAGGIGPSEVCVCN